MPIFAYFLTVFASYLLGSIPTGFLVAKARGVDIRSVGSGNIGATNVVRSMGKKAGIAVLAFDVFKGWLAVEGVAVLVCRWFCPAGDELAREWVRICAALAAVLGHNYTCWLGFKGGKGIATSAGVLAAWVPYSLAIILTIWIVVFFLSRYVSLASIAASSALPVAAWLTGEKWRTIAVTGGMAVLAVYKHKGNIRRLRDGTESRFGRPAPPRPPA